MRRAKVDSTQGEIVEALRAHGCLVLIVNKEFDLLVYRRARMAEASHPEWVLYMVECKGPLTRTTENQKQLVADGWPLVFLRGVEEVREWLAS